VRHPAGVRSAVAPPPASTSRLESRAVNPYLFVGGCLRSGTTLTRRILDTHPLLAVVHETQWLPRLFERGRGVTNAGIVTAELLPLLVGHPRFTRLEMEPKMVERLFAEGSPLRYAELVSHLFDLYGERRGKPLVGEKSPGYVRHIPTLTKLWPHARFIHVIRDGRDVSLSVLSWKKRHKLTRFSTWTQDPLATAALWWEWHVRMGVEDGSALAPSHYRELRYEALVRRPAITDMCTWLGLDYDESMLAYHEGQRVRGHGQAARGPGLPVTPGLRSWKSQMARDDVVRFEAMCGDLIQALGYERVTAQLPARSLDAAARLRRSFAADLRRQRRAAPRAWIDAN
jgi:hypothetical protein